MVSNRAIAAMPQVIPNSGDTGWFANQLNNNVDRRTTPWATGDVVRKGDTAQEFSLMV